MAEYLPWASLAALGAYHGLNPGMGWLFAVALGLQERSRRAVYRAFAPIALGHALSVAAVVAVIGLAQNVMSADTLRVAGAAALVGFGVYKLMRATHPRWVGMRVGFRDLTAWSFLMATAHGAGLMLMPILLALAPGGAVAAAGHAGHGAHAGHVGHALRALAPAGAAGAVGLHTAVMFGVMALIAVVVYEKLGVAILRKAWLNLDRIWAVALVAVGVVTWVG
jgi:hypothetical protein